jgi:hypothetical protein
MTCSEADAAMRTRVTDLMMNVCQVNLVVTFIRKSENRTTRLVKNSFKDKENLGQNFYNCKNISCFYATSSAQSCQLKNPLNCGTHISETCDTKGWEPLS